MTVRKREGLEAEIAARAPWYQRIEFPDSGLATTDREAWCFPDASPDNQIDGLSAEEARRLRPLPKWRHIEKVLPDVAGLEVLEIGSNCGFFSFQFARLGAKRVLGIDVAPKWIENARFCAGELGLAQVSFENADFMAFDGSTPRRLRPWARLRGRVRGKGLLGRRDAEVPLPEDRFDLAFMSTVLDHTFFPFFTIYKMLRIARHWVVIDSPILPESGGEGARLEQRMAPDGSHHANLLSPALYRSLLRRFGIPEEDVRASVYADGQHMTLVVDTRRMAPQLRGA